MRFTSTVFLLLFAFTSIASVRADVRLPAIFGDHMVLQRDQSVPVWGWAEPNEKVTVTAGAVKATSTAGADGKWSVRLQGLKASDQPIDLMVAGKNQITFHDVLVGDVWVCSGQSNMEFNLGGGSFGFGGAHNAVEEIPKTNIPTLRLFIVTKKIAFEPQSDCGGSWVVSTPETAPKFSAVGYFFAREILKDQKVPVGMIGNYGGGTPAESWTSLEALKTNPALNKIGISFEKYKMDLPEQKKKYVTEILPNWQKEHDAWEAEIGKPYNESLKKWTEAVALATKAGEQLPSKPQLVKPESKKPIAPDLNPCISTVLANGMIAPIVPYAIKGVIWYQGESNADKAKEYETLFPAMITDWRTRWAEGDFPFIWVQLANYMARNSTPIQTVDYWPGLRDAQLKTLKLPNTGQAVIFDIGQGEDIHPKDKLDVGFRLALAACHVAYGENMVYSGPTFDSFKIEGVGIRLKFKNAGTGLEIGVAPSTKLGVAPEQPASELKGFAIAGEDHKFVWASARIDGESVIVTSPEVKEPKAVRYGWASNPEVNLYNKENLPASPFRTDDWANPAPQVKP